MFGSSSHANDSVLIVDVQSDGAGAALMQLRKGKPAEIVVAAYSELSYETRSEEAQIAGVRACMNEVTEKVLSMRPTDVSGVVHQVYAVVHSPWTDVRVVRGESRSASDIRVTNTLITKIAQEAMQRESMDATTHIESSIVRIELNGYPTAKPIDKHARHIVLTVIASTCDAHIREGVLQVVSQAHITQPPLLRSSVRGFTIGANAIASTPTGDHTIIDFSRAGSRVIRVINGLPTTMTHIEYGLNSLFSHIAHNKHPADILATMRLLEEGTGTDSVLEAFRTDLAKAETELSTLFMQAFASIISGGLLPEQLVLIVHPVLAPWLSRFFARIDFAQSVVTQRPFRVHVLGREHFESSVSVREGVDATLGLVCAASLVYNEPLYREV